MGPIAGNDAAGGNRPRFSHVKAGPARALQTLLHALRRGDSLVALSASSRCERQAILSQIERLAGRHVSRAVHLRVSEVGDALAVHLRNSGLTCNSGGEVSLFAPWQPERTLLIVDDAELLDSRNCALLCRVSDRQSGNPAQVLIAGGSVLLPRLCNPEFAEIWRRTCVAVSLESAAPHYDSDVSALREEIERTEARLEAQRRILAIFASDADAAPRSGWDS